MHWLVLIVITGNIAMGGSINFTTAQYAGSSAYCDGFALCDDAYSIEVTVLEAPSVMSTWTLAMNIAYPAGNYGTGIGKTVVIPYGETVIGVK